MKKKKKKIVKSNKKFKCKKKALKYKKYRKKENKKKVDKNKSKKDIRNIIICAIFSILIICLILLTFNLKKEVIVFKFKMFKAGQSVIFDDLEWYVIKNTGFEESELELISKMPFDLNKDGRIDEKDMIEFDIEESLEYSTKNAKNIGYYITHNLLNCMKSHNFIKEIRLLTSEEYISLREQMNFGYDWNEGNWLASKETKKWWLETSKYDYIYAVTERGSYMLDTPTSKNYIRPVIKVLKSNIK